ncbi:unnamed protein product [Phytophthora lilii]|uniref:Unnamed protein product n=1 Tax=Phytophthora lilii TaxID=2077276 RepID=A0A9W6WUV9_9STRA|nr:unnamed protein product [Phytophthora lilii]
MEARQQANGREPSGDEHEDSDTELDAADTSVLSTERRPVLGKRPRVATPSHHFSSEHSGLEHVLTSIRDIMAKMLDCKRQELQLRRDELEFQKEALATKMEERRQAREEQRRDEKEQREADRQQRLELARIENEKNLAFLKAVMESAQQQRR